MKVIIIGGGASGMTAAIIAKRNNNDVTIIEKNNILGKKLLLTGNGRCNYFNDNMNLNNFYSNSDISRFINEFNLEKVKKFFDSIGIYPRIKNGLYYPYANTSYAIQNSLIKEIELLNVNVIKEEVINIKKDKLFIITTTNNKYECDKLILATGGITYPKTGSDGFGYKLLQSFNHHIIEPKEALVPLVTNDDVKDWQGIRVNVEVSLYKDNKFIKKEFGEAQLTNYGISGICIMNLSRNIDLKYNNYLSINFLPDINNVIEFIDKRNKLLKGRTIIELLESMINYKLLYFLLKKINFNVNSKWDDLNKNEKELLVNTLSNFKLNIVDTKGKDYGEVTTGGVLLDEINDNCESKIIKNLFITGELLDIDGICGGYNLTIAWLSGILAGE